MVNNFRKTLKNTTENAEKGLLLRFPYFAGVFQHVCLELERFPPASWPAWLPQQCLEKGRRFATGRLQLQLDVFSYPGAIESVPQHVCQL